MNYHKVSRSPNRPAQPLSGDGVVAVIRGYVLVRATDKEEGGNKDMPQPFQEGFVGEIRPKHFIRSIGVREGVEPLSRDGVTPEGVAREELPTLA